MGKGGDGGTDKIIAAQEKEAEAARAKEAKRQARIAEGRQKIKEAFEGRKAVAAGTKSFDWNAAMKAFTDSGKAPTAGAAVSGLPKGYTYFKTADVVTPGTSMLTGSNARIPGTNKTVPVTQPMTPASARAFFTAPSERAASVKLVSPLVPRGGGTSGSPNGGGNTRNSNPQLTIPQRVGIGGSPNGGGNTQNSNPMRYVSEIPRGGGTSGSPNGGGNTRNSNPTVANGGMVQGGGSTTKPGEWVIKGPDGKLYKQGDEIKWATPGVAGTSGIDPLYDKYRNAYVSSFMPQVAKQYGDAQKQTTFDLARAGTLKSSMAIDAATDLAEQNRLNRADVITKADQGVGDLKQRVADERLKAENQLMATEDPNVAANTALASVRNIGLAAPPSTPLGDVFKVALIGGANAITGYKNQSSINDTNNLWRQYGGGTSVVGKK